MSRFACILTTQFLLLLAVTCSPQPADENPQPARRDASYEQRRLGMEGIVLSNLPEPSRVLLRFPLYAGSNLLIGQGAHGDFTHFGPLSEALDFLVEEGTPLLAVRSGQVERVISHHTEGGLEEYHKTMGNLIEIRHDDGTIALYLHLKPNGSRVSPGQRVNEGTHIGDSGNTGYSSTPHLHLHIWANDSRTNSIPMFFRTSAGPLRLVEGLEYTSPAYSSEGTALPTSIEAPPRGIYSQAYQILADIANTNSSLSNACIACTRWISNARADLQKDWQQITREAQAGNRSAQKTLEWIMKRTDLSRHPDLARVLDPKNPYHDIVYSGLLIWWSITGSTGDK